MRKNCINSLQNICKTGYSEWVILGYVHGCVVVALADSPRHHNTTRTRFSRLNRNGEQRDVQS